MFVGSQILARRSLLVHSTHKQVFMWNCLCVPERRGAPLTRIWSREVPARIELGTAEEQRGGGGRGRRTVGAFPDTNMMSKEERLCCRDELHTVPEEFGAREEDMVLNLFSPHIR